MTIVPQRPRDGGIELVVKGTVQGVGFRPFVYRLAIAEQLSGWVRNTADGLHIALFGHAARIDRLKQRLTAEAPPLANIEGIDEYAIAGDCPDGFTIMPSASGDMRTSVPLDAALCEACRRELFDPSDRRFRYPFLNCTHCGPRFSIIERLPYDRANTSMKRFAMCATCREEYRDIDDRRFHAQPTACPQCGPQIWLERSGARGRAAAGQGAIEHAWALLRDDGILAIKGIGGFHLACNALSEVAIARLRERKCRPGKPFAVMVRDLDVADRYCTLGESERLLLQDRAAPIVLADLRPDADLPEGLAPGLNRLGVMLPYSPLHALLMEPFDHPVVMTSGNAGGDPQVIDNGQARQILAPHADWFLMHDRVILNRVDDSLVQVVDGNVQVLRCGRGMAPQPIALPSGFAHDHPQVLAFGGDIKNAFAIAMGGQVILSQHVGDLISPGALADLEHHVRLYGDMYDFEPAAIASDRHPGYQSHKAARAMAENLGLPLIEIAHHHAHAASCMAANGLALDHPPVLALVQDGIGVGDDGGWWGAELLLCSYRSARRLATLRPAPLAGGDRAAREPWRNLAVRLVEAFGDPGRWPAAMAEALAGRPVAQVIAAARAGINAPACSSAGRLFDAVAAATRLCIDRQDYEGEAAMRLQAAAEDWMKGGRSAEGYRFDVTRTDGGLAVLDPASIWPAIAEDLDSGRSAGEIAARFHVGWAMGWADIVRSLSDQLGDAPKIILSGGVFQNRLLASILQSDLASSGYAVLQHRDVPANDGGLALGQIVLALAQDRTDRN